MSDILSDIQETGTIRVLIDCPEKVKRFGDSVINAFYKTELADFHPGFIELATNITLSFTLVPGNRQATVEVISEYIKNIRKGYSQNIVDVYFNENSTPNFKLNDGAVIIFDAASAPELIDSIALVNDKIHREIIHMKKPPTADEIISAAIFQTGLALIKANADRN